MTGDKLMKIIAIIGKYEAKVEIIGAEHDVIWFNGPKKMRKDDKAALFECDVHWNDEYDYWMAYV